MLTLQTNKVGLYDLFCNFYNVCYTEYCILNSQTFLL